MSQPNFPDTPSLTRDDVINQIISSIAMEELGLSHIINAEGEKLQYALGTIPGVTGPEQPATIDDLLDLNKSIRETLDSTMQNQMFLKAKLQSALAASIMQGPTGPTGPTGPLGGPTGPTGPTGLTGLTGPTGPQGLQGLHGPQGIQGIQGIQGPTGAQGPTGQQGLQGSQGVQGTPGESSVINLRYMGNYDPSKEYKINDYVVSDQGNGFVARIDNPKGPPPSDFVSNDEWAAFVAAGAPGKQGVQGFQGPTGPTGLQGASGLQGSVGPQGQPGTVGPQGLKGDQGPTGPTGTQGVQGVTGPSGPKGDQGATGPTGPRGIQGVTGPTGPKGDQGSTGPTGPEASSFTIIPFASQRAPLTYASNGAPTRVSLIGFGYLDRALGADFAIPLASDGSFNLSASSDRQVVFSVPFDMKITSVYATVGNFDVFPIGQLVGTVFPYVQLYRALPDSNTFIPIPEAAAIPVQGLGPSPVPAATMRPASATGLNVELPAGTRIAIGGLVKITGDNASRSYYLYYTGGIGLTRWFR